MDPVETFVVNILNPKLQELTGKLQHMIKWIKVGTSVIIVLDDSIDRPVKRKGSRLGGRWQAWIDGEAYPFGEESRLLIPIFSCQYNDLVKCGFKLSIEPYSGRHEIFFFMTRGTFTHHRSVYPDLVYVFKRSFTFCLLTTMSDRIDRIPRNFIRCSAEIIERRRLREWRYKMIYPFAFITCNPEKHIGSSCRGQAFEETILVHSKLQEEIKMIL